MREKNDAAIGVALTDCKLRSDDTNERRDGIRAGAHLYIAFLSLLSLRSLSSCESDVTHSDVELT